MGAKSRDKGKRGEAALCPIFDRAGVPYLREQDGRLQGADFRLDEIVMEVRRREQLRLVAWHRELEAKTADHLVPVLVWRPNNEPWRVSQLLTDWLDMLQRARA